MSSFSMGGGGTHCCLWWTSEELQVLVVEPVCACFSYSQNKLIEMLSLYVSCVWMCWRSSQKNQEENTGKKTASKVNKEEKTACPDSAGTPEQVCCLLDSCIITPNEACGNVRSEGMSGHDTHHRQLRGGQSYRNTELWAVEGTSLISTWFLAHLWRWHMSSWALWANAKTEPQTG